MLMVLNLQPLFSAILRKAVVLLGGTLS